MDTKGNIIVFGSISAFIIMIVVGYCIHDSVIASLLRIFGILGVLAWIASAFILIRALNTDI